MRMKTHRRALLCEQLESRFVLSSLGQPQTLDSGAVGDSVDFQPVIVAGDPSGTPADSPANRVDPNDASSPFAGVGSLQISTIRGTYICTGTPIDTIHVLTAGHCIDLNDDGVSNKKDGIRSITFNLNLDTDAGTDQVDVRITASSWQAHPDFTGFNRPSINDDLAVITLGGTGVPAGVPTYSLNASPMVAGATHLYLVGYGRSGDGVNGYTTNASFTIKRTGENIVDAFYGQDDAGRAAANEVFRFDFDGPTGNGSFGGPTLGNDRETTLGGGDSGGPSLVLCDGCDPTLASSYRVVGVNTFTQGTNAPRFGSLGGGINVGPYASWILGPHGTSSFGGGSGGNGGGPPAGNSTDSGEYSAVVVPPNLVNQVSSFVAPSGPAVSSSDARDDSDSLPAAGTETAGADLFEPVVVVVAPPASSESSSAAGTSHDGFLNALDAVLEDWRPIVGR